MSLYKKVIKVGKQAFRYNLEHNTLEWFNPKTNEVIDSRGLNLADYEDNPTYWCETYAQALDEDFELMMELLL